MIYWYFLLTNKNYVLYCKIKVSKYFAHSTPNSDHSSQNILTIKFCNGNIRIQG